MYYDYEIQLMCENGQKNRFIFYCLVECESIDWLDNCSRSKSDENIFDREEEDVFLSVICHGYRCSMSIFTSAQGVENGYNQVISGSKEINRNN